MYLLSRQASSRLVLPPRHPRLSRGRFVPSSLVLCTPKEAVPSRKKPPFERVKTGCVTRASVFSLLSVLSASLSSPGHLSVKREHAVPGRYFFSSASAFLSKITLSSVSPSLTKQPTVAFQTRALQARLGTRPGYFSAVRFPSSSQERFRQNDLVGQHGNLLCTFARSHCPVHLFAETGVPSTFYQQNDVLCRLGLIGSSGKYISTTKRPPFCVDCFVKSFPATRATTDFWLRRRFCSSGSISKSFMANRVHHSPRVHVDMEKIRCREDQCSLFSTSQPRNADGGDLHSRGGGAKDGRAENRTESGTVVDLRRLERFFLEGPAPSTIVPSSSPTSPSTPYSSFSSVSTCGSLSPSSSPSPIFSTNTSCLSQPEPSRCGRLFVLILNRPLPAYAAHLLQSCDAYFVADGGGNFLYQLFQNQVQQDIEDRKESLSRRKDMLAARLSSQQLQLQEEMEMHVSHQLEKDHQTLPQQREQLRKLRQQLSHDEEKAVDLPEIDRARVKLDKLPEAICGDLDSLTEEAKSYFRRRHVEVIQWENQDLSDLEKAWKLLLEPRCSSRADVVVILGAIGGRFDHSISAVHFLHKLGAAREQEQDEPSRTAETRGKPVLNRPPFDSQSQGNHEMPQVFLIGEDSLCFLVPRGTTRIRLSPLLTTRHCALIPFGDSPRNATTTGLRWDLKPGMRLKFGDFISTSNQVALRPGDHTEQGDNSEHVGEEQDVEVSTDAPMLWYSQMRLQPSGELIPPLLTSHQC